MRCKSLPEEWTVGQRLSNVSFKRQPWPEEEGGAGGGQRVCVDCVCVCKRKRERKDKEKSTLLEKTQSLIADVGKMFLIYSGRGSRSGPSVSLHGRKPRKNNTLTLSSVQLQIEQREGRGR